MSIGRCVAISPRWFPSKDVGRSAQRARCSPYWTSRKGKLKFYWQGKASHLAMMNKDARYQCKAHGIMVQIVSSGSTDTVLRRPTESQWVVSEEEAGPKSTMRMRNQGRSHTILVVGRGARAVVGGGCLLPTKVRAPDGGRHRGPGAVISD